MDIVQFNHLFIADFNGYSFILEHNFTFIIALVTLSFSVLLRSKKIFLIQLLLFLAFFGVDEFFQNGSLFILLFIIQIGILGFVGFRLKKAVDRNFNLVLEKTHQMPANHSAGGNPGTQSSFF